MAARKKVAFIHISIWTLYHYATLQHVPVDCPLSMQKSHFLKNLRDKVRGRNDPKSQGAGLRGSKVGTKLRTPESIASSDGGSEDVYNVYGPPTLDELLIQMQSIREVKEPEEKRILFVRKLRLCSYSFDFNQDASKKEAEAREMKRRMLVELIDHLSSSRIWVCEESLKAILHMISSNLFRPLPPSLYKDFDPDEDEPTHDPAWYVIRCSMQSELHCEYALCLCPSQIGSQIVVVVYGSGCIYNSCTSFCCVSLCRTIRIPNY